MNNAPYSLAEPHHRLQLLAFDTSTDQLSAAVGIWPANAHKTAPAQQWQYSGPGAAQSSATLIPTVQNLLQQANVALSELDAIAFGNGPGSFTGLRTACAVAQGLALGACLPVVPVDTLLAVAEDWRSEHARKQSTGTVWSLLDARMDEIYAAFWQWSTDTDTGYTRWNCLCDTRLVKPEQLLQLPDFTADAVCAGNVQAVYGARLPVHVHAAMPTAQAMLRLAPDLLRQKAACDPALALPRYVRDKVAQTIAERSAQKAL